MDKFDLMNVKLVAHVLSQSVASILCCMTAPGDIAGSGTADFCTLMNDLFRSVNGQVIRHNERPLFLAVTKTSPHLEFWGTFTDFIKSVEFQTKGQNISFLCLQSWLVTFRKMITDQHPMHFDEQVHTGLLLNVFSVVRYKGGNNDHLTPIDFRS